MQPNRNQPADRQRRGTRPSSIIKRSLCQRQNVRHRRAPRSRCQMKPLCPPRLQSGASDSGKTLRGLLEDLAGHLPRFPGPPRTYPIQLRDLQEHCRLLIASPSLISNLPSPPLPQILPPLPRTNSSPPTTLLRTHPKLLCLPSLQLEPSGLPGLNTPGWPNLLKPPRLRKKSARAQRGRTRVRRRSSLQPMGMAAN